MNEADGTVNFRVGVIEGNLAAPVTINFATSDGSAIGKCMHEDHNYRIACNFRGAKYLWFSWLKV